MANINDKNWDKIETFNNLLFINWWSDRKNKSVTGDISATLYQSQPEELGPAIINDAIGSQQ